MSLYKGFKVNGPAYYYYFLSKWLILGSKRLALFCKPKVKRDAAKGKHPSSLFYLIFMEATIFSSSISVFLKWSRKKKNHKLHNPVAMSESFSKIFQCVIYFRRYVSNICSKYPKNLWEIFSKIF